MRSRGFTLVEILISIGIFVLIAGIGLLVSMETYRGSDFRSDRDLLVSLLEHARTQAVDNICLGASCTDGEPHGVHIGGGKYVLFQGASYSAADPENQTFDTHPAITPTGATDIVFTQLTGASSAATITLTGENHTSVITIGSEGQISWTN